VHNSLEVNEYLVKAKSLDVFIPTLAGGQRAALARLNPVCVCIYIEIFVYLFIYVYIYIYGCVYIYIYIYVCMNVCIDR